MTRREPNGKGNSQVSRDQLTKDEWGNVKKIFDIMYRIKQQRKVNTRGV